MVVKIEVRSPDAKLPTRGTEYSGAYDLYAAEIIGSPNKGGRLKVVNIGLAMQPPPGHRIMIAPRSSFTQKGWVMQNSPAIIDEDYTGEIILKFEAIPQEVVTDSYFSTVHAELKYKKFPYKVGDRVAQMWVERVEPIHFTGGEIKPRGDRGSGGFGSTGK